MIGRGRVLLVMARMTVRDDRSDQDVQDVAGRALRDNSVLCDWAVQSVQTYRVKGEAPPQLFEDREGRIWLDVDGRGLVELDRVLRRRVGEAYPLASREGVEAMFGPLSPLRAASEVPS